MDGHHFDFERLWFVEVIETDRAPVDLTGSLDY